MTSEMKDGLWNDLCSEYDAENFCNYLKTSGIKLSSDFKSFEYVWRRDELNHYLGIFVLDHDGPYFTGEVLKMRYHKKLFF